MLLVRIAVGLVLGYVVLLVLAWRFQERLAFPAPRAPGPDPPRGGVANREKIELGMGGGRRLPWRRRPSPAARRSIPIASMRMAARSARRQRPTPRPTIPLRV